MSGKPRIVLCEDWQQETSFAGGEVSDKLKWLDDEHKWVALIADTGGRGVQLVDTLRRHFKSKKTIPNDDIFSFLEVGLAAHKLRLANEYFQMNHAVSYDDILSNARLPGAKKNFPEKFAGGTT